jgi:DNA-binding PadR family transcriptional regulator
VAQVNPTEFAILGLLSEQPRTGYDIKKEVTERLGHFWSESFGHIYPTLRRMHAAKLVGVRTGRATGGRPARKVYTITASGRRALEGWFLAPPTFPRPRNELLLRIFLGRHAPRGLLLRDVSAYRAQVEATLARLREVEKVVAAESEASKDVFYWQLVIDYGVQVFTSLERWAGSAERRLAERGN